MCRRRISVMAVLSVLLASGLFAQFTQRSCITGLIGDKSGAVVAATTFDSGNAPTIGAV